MNVKLPILAGLGSLLLAAAALWQPTAANGPARLERAIEIYGAHSPSSRDGGPQPLAEQLRYAIESGNEERVLQVLALQRIETAMGIPGSAPVIPIAVSAGRLVIARYLIDQGYDLYAVDDQQRNALHIAVLSASTRALELLLTAGFERLDALDAGGRSALAIAIENRAPALAERLLEAGADPDLVDDRGFGPLHHAVLNGFADLVSLLLENGAKADLSFKDGGTALARALEQGRLDIARMLVAAGARVQQIGAANIHRAVLSDRIDTIRFLAQAGADLSVVDGKGNSALVHAVNKHRPESVAALLEAGVDPDSNDRYGRSVLGLATGCGACLEHLLKAGADVDYPGTQMPGYESFAVNTPLIWAVLSRHTDAVGRLLSAGADIRLPDRSQQGRPPLVHAARLHGGAEMIRLLLARGADPNGADAGQWPALLQAVSFSDQATVIALIDGGGDVNRANGHGWTPLMSATANGDMAMVKLLLERGALINARTPKGWTALSESHRYGHFDLSAMLKTAGAVDPVNPPLRSSDQRNRLKIGIEVLD